MIKNNKIFVFLEFKNLKIIFTACNSNYENKYSNSITLDFSSREGLENLSNIIRDNIIKIEKKIGEFVNEINIILDLNKSINIKLNIFKKKENLEVTHEDIKYLIQDARQQIIEQNKNLTILHIVLENFYINKIKKTEISKDFSAEDFSIILNFICYPSEDILNFKNLLKKNQIKVNKFICSKYLESILEKDLPEELQISRAVIKTIMGMNQNEVQIVPKIIKKHPFFERLFKFFLR